ncbi:MAG TPA: outer membrane beta-barrel protein [Micropepsaceae bacterium]|nr:outer membrane beta-barrel protein [Micropepsaceae bacterium]
MPAPGPAQPVVLPVYQIPRPFYDPVGLNLGSFLLFPTASEQLGSDDNIFASDRRRASDIVNTTNEALSMASQWMRHSLTAHFLAGQELYARHSSNNANIWSADFSGRADITTDALFQLDGGFIQQPLPRGTPEAGDTSRRPLFNTTALTAAYVQRDMPLSDRLEFSLRDVAYISDSDASRSGTRFTYRDRVSYDLSPAVSLFVEGAFAQQHWLRRADLRNFDLLTGLLGADVDLPSTAHGEVGIGVLRQSFRDSDLETLVAPTAHEELIWNVLPLTSILATVDRTIIGTETFCDSAASTCRSGSGSLLPGGPGLPPKRNSLQVTTAELGVQHEFFHDILGEASFRYERDHFDFNGLTDRLYALRANVRYLINRNLEADLDYTYRQRTANMSDDHTFNSGPYKENVVSIMLKAGL